MFKDEDRIENVNEALWWSGWHPFLLTISGLLTGLWIGYFTVGLALGAVGFLLGSSWWFLGTREINGRYSDVMRKYGEYTALAPQKFLDVGSDSNSYTLTYSKGGALLVSPAKTYYSTTLVVGDTSIAIHEGVGLDMTKRVPSLEDGTKEIYYDQIASVSYNRPNLEIVTSDGGSLSYRSSREPDDALNDLQKRLRGYKSVSVSSTASDSRQRSGTVVR